MDTPPDTDRPSLAPSIALMALGVLLIAVALAPGMPKIPAFAAAIALIGIGQLRSVRIARGGAARGSERTAFARALRQWIWTTIVGAVCFAIGLAVLDDLALVAFAGLLLVLLGAVGTIVIALRHRA